MTLLRLLRRSFLSLLVGVTAFGLSGWLLRPKPNWVVELPADGSGEVILGGDRGPFPDSNPWARHVASADEPIWLKRDGEGFIVGSRESTQTSVVAVDPRTGAELRRWPLTPDESRHSQFVGPAGRLVVMCSGAGTIKFRVLDARTGYVVARELPAYWALGGPGASAWRFEQRGDADALHRINLLTGAIVTSELKSPIGRMFGRDPAGDLSADGRCFAAKTIAERGDPHFPVFQIWSLDPPTMLKAVTVPLPNNASAGEIDVIRWIDGGRRLAVKISAWKLPDEEPHQHLRWLYDPKNEEFTPAPDERPEIPVPGAKAYLTLAVEETACSVIPKTIRKVLPLTWQQTWRRTIRWRQAGRSLDVGCRDPDSPSQTRPDSLIAVCRAPWWAPASLECWPLPPRDPKWPAAVIGLLCSAAAWLLFAWRASPPRQSPSV